MATSKPRITVTLEPRLYEVVHRLAKASSQTMSGVIGDFLQVAEGPMERAVAILERAGQAQNEAKSAVQRSLSKAERSIVPVLLEGLAQQELALAEAGLDHEDLASALRAESGMRSKERAARRSSPPVPVTRGVGDPKKAKKAAKGRPGRA